MLYAIINSDSGFALLISIVLLSNEKDVISIVDKYRPRKIAVDWLN